MGRTASLIVSGSASVIIVAWMALLLTPYGWQHKTGHILKIQMGLYGMSTEKGVTAELFSTLSDGISSKLDKLTTHYTTIREGKDTFCVAFLPEVCESWQRVMWAGMGMLFFGFFGVVLIGLGASFQHYYWHTKALATPRLWARGFLIAGPCFFLVGILMYTFLTYDFYPFPRFSIALTAESSSLSVAYALACTFTVLSIIPVAISEVFNGKSFIEEYNEGLKANEEESFVANAYQHLESQNQAYPQQDAQYGSAPQYGSYPQYGSTEQYGSSPPPPSYGAAPYAPPQPGMAGMPPSRQDTTGMPAMPPPGMAMA